MFTFARTAAAAILSALILVGDAGEPNAQVGGIYTGSPGGGTGNIAGPATSTDNAIARFDGAGGKTLQGSGVIIDDQDRLIIGAVSALDNLHVEEGTPGAAASIQIRHSDNTDAGSRATLNLVTVDGTSGDQSIVFAIANVSDWSIGVDNSDEDKLKIATTSVLDGTTRLTIDRSGLVGVGTTTPDELLHMAGAVDGRFTGLLIENTQADAAASTNETAEILFGFDGKNIVARITADKLNDYTSADDEDSRLGFWVDSDGTLTEVAHFMPDGLMLLLADSKIRFAATSGGGGSIQYKSLAGSNRSAFLLAGNNVVAITSRGANGTVEMRANTSTGGNAGEVTVATFEDDQITFLASGGNMGIGGIPLVGFHATGLVEGTDDYKDMVAVFQGATGGTQTGYLFASDDAASDVWLAFRGIPSDTNQWLIGARFFSGDTFAIGYGDKASTMTFPLDTGAKFVITTGGLVGIGTTTPATSALLELSSTTGALLVTRMTTTQRDALTAVNGMIIYNTTTATMQGRINGSWTNM